MSERKAGWYWVKAFPELPWECLRYQGEWWHGCGLNYEPAVIGPRIPTPDEPWQCVPVEPTRTMVMAGYYPTVKAKQREEMYRAMLAAAPKLEDDTMKDFDKTEAIRDLYHCHSKQDLAKMVVEQHEELANCRRMYANASAKLGEIQGYLGNGIVGIEPGLLKQVTDERGELAVQAERAAPKPEDDDPDD